MTDKLGPRCQQTVACKLGRMGSLVPTWNTHSKDEELCLLGGRCGDGGGLGMRNKGGDKWDKTFCLGKMSKHSDVQQTLIRCLSNCRHWGHRDEQIPVAPDLREHTVDACEKRRVQKVPQGSHGKDPGKHAQNLSTCLQAWMMSKLT